MDLDAFELDARRGKYAQISAAQGRDALRVAEIQQVQAERAARVPEALEYLEELRASGDGATFANEMEQWCRRPGFTGFVGPNGQMFLKQLVQASDDGAGAALLADVLVVPVDDEDAEAKLRRTLAYIETVKHNGHPGPARAPFLLSFFWGLQDGSTWPVAWASAVGSLRNLGWHRQTGDHAADYLAYAAIVRSLGDPVEVAYALHWFDKHRFVGLAPSLLDRCAHGRTLARHGGLEAGYPDEASAAAASANAQALTYELWLAGSGLQQQVAEALGRNVKLQYSKPTTGQHLYRWWGWVSWPIEGGNASLRLWATGDGVLIGLHPGHVRAGWFEEAGHIAQADLSEGYELFVLWEGEDSGQVRSTGREYTGGEFLVGRLLPGTSALDREDLIDDIGRVAADLLPLVERLYAAATPSAPEHSDEPLAIVSGQSQADLEALVAEFRAQRGPANPKDEKARADRAAFAEFLSSDELEIAEPTVLRQIINTGRYGSPGPQAALNTTITNLEGADLEAFCRLISDLLWGGDPAEVRLDAALDAAANFKGLGESVLMKLLSIADPKRFVPVFPFKGDMGKAKLMQLIGLTPPPSEKTRGQKQVESNDAIRHVLDPLLSDAWLQGQFLYWLKGRTEIDIDRGTQGDGLGALADELFLPPDTLEEIVELLQDKKQIIFYGPPGTGKTYVAQALARLLAGDPNRYQLVQFHPSTSYEDFFEGYRPQTTGDGQLSYHLVPGPLARLAAQAAALPGVDHVMVIDEINRANLPKVLGELLFLLEYREEQVHTLYRPDDPFELPSNLLFIGTMNTADKSIALIDAAMRRRFHFVPFFPHEEPHSLVLSAWLEEHNPSAVWVAGLVEHVNGRLVEILGGPHLQIGPSYFFDAQLDEQKVERIWKYSIHPFIEDQLWGQAEVLRTFEFRRVLAAYQEAGGEVPGPQVRSSGRAASTVSKDGTKLDEFTGEELPVTKFPTRLNGDGVYVRGPVARHNLAAWRAAKLAQELPSADDWADDAGEPPGEVDPA